MSEAIFTLKTLCFTMIVVTLMQIRISGTTIESRMENWLETSTVARFVQGAAVGAVHASHDLYQTMNGFWSGSGDHRNEKASR